MTRLFRLVQVLFRTLLSSNSRSSHSPYSQDWEARCSSVAPTSKASDARLRQALALALGILLGILVSAFMSGQGG